MNKQPQSALPPGQQLVAPGKWPLVGEREPVAPAEPWIVRMDGLVEKPKAWALDDLAQQPQQDLLIDIHCVTRWSKLGVRFRGVLLEHLLEHARPQTEAKFISFVAHSNRDHSTSLPIADALQLRTLIATECEGEPLSTEHGGPVRVIVPGRYFYKSLKWLNRIELLAEDRLGYWEAEAGYHNTADPDLEQRYIAASITKQQAAKLVQQKSLDGEDLLGLELAGHSLQGLRAKDALLRNANFRRADLTKACFDGANLSNAHFEEAMLQDTTFIGADCEGASFAGADLRGANFTDASLLAASFSPYARLDQSTRISAAQIETLLPAEAAYVAAAMGRNDSAG